MKTKENLRHVTVPKLTESEIQSFWESAANSLTRLRSSGRSELISLVCMRALIHRRQMEGWYSASLRRLQNLNANLFVTASDLGWSWQNHEENGWADLESMWMASKLAFFARKGALGPRFAIPWEYQGNCPESFSFLAQKPT